MTLRLGFGLDSQALQQHVQVRATDPSDTRSRRKIPTRLLNYATQVLLAGFVDRHVDGLPVSGSCAALIPVSRWRTVLLFGVCHGIALTAMGPSPLSPPLVL